MFLSTPPSRVATSTGNEQRAFVQVSIHATLAGGDLLACPCRVEKSVSIHATLAGGDLANLRGLYSEAMFLSTPPSRVATCGLSAGFRVGGCFYPRHPRGWRHEVMAWNDESEVVSIHATLAGGDVPWRRLCAPIYSFLSTPPSRVATERIYAGLNRIGGFYPRHPRGWRHLIEAAHDILVKAFLSTPPSRVATPERIPQGYLLVVSIHATLAGGDSCLRQNHTADRWFLSTPPSRVATP